eukprot:m.285715 g.285715  ORF g.285715 m.285715 type:complete len:86 (-) comp11429_c0_seq1:229-486(-)
MASLLVRATARLRTASPLLTVRWQSAAAIAELQERTEARTNQVFGCSQRAVIGYFNDDTAPRAAVSGKSARQASSSHRAARATSR